MPSISTGDNAPLAAPAWLAERRRAFETALAAHLTALKSKVPPHSRLLDAVEYSLAGGGKRLRPLLVIESCRTCGGTAPAALPAALAIECIHTFSLIHDDLPAMDDDDLRRGAPTNHKVFGEALATLAGDWLVAHAFALLAATPGPRVAEMVEALARGTEAMVVGQAADIEGERRPTDAGLVEFVHRHKTAALIEASCVMGALAADAPADDLGRLAHFGRGLGIAFQIVDDLLDRGGRVERLGKRAGKDQQADKQTFPAAFGEEASRRRATEEIDGAIAALDHYQARAEPLRELARFVLARDH